MLRKIPMPVMILNVYRKEHNPKVVCGRMSSLRGLVLIVILIVILYRQPQQERITITITIMIRIGIGKSHDPRIDDLRPWSANQD